MKKCEQLQSLKEKMNRELEDILKYFQFEYISDIRDKRYHKKVIKYIHERQLKTNDDELYQKLLEYVNWK